MKKTLYNFSKILCAVLMIGFLCSCSAHKRFIRSELYNPIEDYHVFGQIDYPESPFNSVIQETTSDKNSLLNKHYAYILDIGDEALLSRVHLIRQAKKSILIQTFIWTNDESGRFVAYELIKAAERGVKVKIINDQWRGEDTPNFVAFFESAHPNIEIKHYNPSAKQIAPSAIVFASMAALNFKQVNQRMHNKIFVVDDRIALTGGRNYENDYFDRGQTRNFKDRDILIIGPIVKKMTDSFMQYWAFKLSVESSGLLDVNTALKKGQFDFFEKDQIENGMLFENISKQASDYNYIRSVFVDKLLSFSDVSYVYDPPGKNNSLRLSGGSITANTVRELIEKAQFEILIQTPYLVLDRKQAKAFKKLRKQKPELEIFISTNSLAATDHVHAYAFAYKQKKLFVKDLRARIYEFKPVPKDVLVLNPLFNEDFASLKSSTEDIPSFSILNDITEFVSRGKHLCIHSKSIVVDDHVALIGSYNIDPRSAHLNTEVALIINDKHVAKALKNNILLDMAPQNSWTVGMKKDVPVLTKSTHILTEVINRVPLIDIWPFHYTTNFELKENKKELPFYDKNFYDNYDDVGAFPQVNLPFSEIELRLIKTFGGFATPII